MSNYGELADKVQIEKTIKALLENGIEAEYVDSGKEAKEKVLLLLPEGAEVMDMSSETLKEIGLIEEIQEFGRYDSVKKKLMTMDRKTQGRQMQMLGAAPEWSVGSVHAVTEDGKVVVASNTGSQLPAYAYGAQNVIWVVGAQKITRDLDDAMKRVYDYVLPLESERMKKLYGMLSNVSKILIINREIAPGRLKMIIVGEKLGF